MTYPRYVPHTTGSGKWNHNDINAVVDHVLAGETVTGYLAYPYNFLIRNVAGVYDAINSTGTLTYGGTDDAGGVDGGDFEAVYTAVDTACGNGDKIVFAGNETYVGDVTITKRLTLEGSNAVGPTIKGTVTVNSDYVTIRDLIINPDNTAVNGLVLGTSANYCVFENVRVSTAQYGLYKASTNDEGICNTFIHLDIRDCTIGVYIAYVDGAYRFNSNTFLRCTIADNDEDGMILCDGAGIELIGCDIENNGHHGVDIQSVKSVKFDNCYFENNAQADGATYSELHGITNAAGGAPFCNLITLDTCNFQAATYAAVTVNFESRVSNWEVRNCNFINTGRTNSLKTHSSCTFGLISLQNKAVANSLGTNSGVILLSEVAGTLVARSAGYVSALNESVFTHNLGVNPTNIQLTQKRNPIISGTTIALNPTVLSFDTTTFTIQYVKTDVSAGTVAYVTSGDARQIYWEAVYEA